jgi:DoxX-like family
MNVVLWILQVLLALLFVFAGGLKLWMPINALVQAQEAQPNAIVMSPWFLKFIGLCELFGGFGLVLPAVFKRNYGLIPLAAVGLLIIMIGALVISFMQGGFTAAVVPLVTVLLLAFVAYGRWRVRPLG